MNNYCTNCGKKLEENEIKCKECNTYIIDLKSYNKKKIFKIICFIILFIIILIIVFITSYNIHFKNLYKTLQKKYLKDEFLNAEYVNYDSCRACEGSCDGSCINSPKIVGCFKYYYKSSPDKNKADIVIYSNRGKISLDTYSAIISKYGFKENYDDYEDRYQTNKRTFLYINVDNIKINIENVYKMINEIITNYKKDNKEFLSINISNNNNNNIEISNYNTNNKEIFVWEFNYKTKLLNPSLSEVKKLYQPFDNHYNSYNSYYGGNLDND